MLRHAWIGAEANGFVDPPLDQNLRAHSDWSSVQHKKEDKGGVGGGKLFTKGTDRKGLYLFAYSCIAQHECISRSVVALSTSAGR